MDLFGRFGAINSVKVMWPRTEEERVRRRNCGFVSFKRRCDAEEALLELQDAELEEYRMVICWGKAVKISSTPFTLPGNRSAPAADPSPVPAAAAAPPPPFHLQSIAAVQPPSTSFPPRPPPPPFPSPTPGLLSSAGLPVLLPSSTVAVVAPTVSDSASSAEDRRIHVGTSIEPLAPAVSDFSGMSVDAFMQSVAPLPPNPPPPVVPTSTNLPTTDDTNTVQVSIPSNSTTRALIDLVAKYTAADGHAFETVTNDDGSEEDENEDDGLVVSALDRTVVSVMIVRTPDADVWTKHPLVRYCR